MFKSFVCGLALLLGGQFIVHVPPTHVAALPSTTTVGYTSRASGFDLNFNGTVNDNTSDRAICDAQGDSSSTVGEDVDGNGVFDRQVYVDYTSGVNNSTCGLPSAPCATINYAMNGTNSSVTGGAIQTPSAGQIQAICFKGTGREQVVFTQSGPTGTYTLPQTGSQANTFNLPRYPFILSGWDANNNDQYPPFDAADTAVLDCASGGVALPFAIDNGASGAQSRIEVAHFTAKNCGQNGEIPAGFARVAYGGGSQDAIYFHDIETVDILKGIANDSGRDTFDFFTSSSILSNVALVNIKSTNSGGGYWLRGSGVNSVTVLGPYRFQNITATGFGATSDFWAGIKLFDTITGIEVLDSVFTSNAAAWSPQVTGAPTFGIGLSACTRGWRIVNNTLNDFKDSISIQGYAQALGFCEGRTLTDVIIDRNTIRQTYSSWNSGPDSHGLNIDDGLTSLATSENITITNNFFSTSVGWDDCMRLDQANPGGTQPGTVVVAGNTCDGDVKVQGGIVVGHLSGSEDAFPLNAYVFKDNIISGITTAGMWSYRFTFAPSSLVSDGNVFTPSMIFQWNNVDKATIALFRSVSGTDTNSFVCAPSYVSQATGNFRLQLSDTCALNTGISISPYTVVDIDNLSRPIGVTDIGAAEHR